MEFQELIRQRYSCRAYQSRDVPEEIVQRVLEAFVLAPTAANRQSMGLIVIHTAGRELELRRIYKADWFAAQPPVVVCACAVPEKCWTRRDGKNYADVDVGIAMDHLILAACAEGLGTCWIGAFDAPRVREILGIPPEIVVVQLLPLGYPRDPAPVAKKRLPLSAIVHEEGWRG